MSLVYHKPQVIALVLLVLLTVLVTAFVILSFAMHTNAWHMLLSLQPYRQCRCG